MVWCKLFLLKHIFTLNSRDEPFGKLLNPGAFYVTEDLSPVTAVTLIEQSHSTHYKTECYS